MGVATTTITDLFSSVFGQSINMAVWLFGYAWPYLLGIAVLYFLVRLARSAFHF